MFVYIVYGIIAILLLIIIYGAWSRRKIYNFVDYLDRKKIELMNTPVTEELSKIKGLKMSGETEERFEQWRNGWDEIVAVQLPNIEERIFDMEELANKYRFSKAKQLGALVEAELQEIEEHIGHMIAEVDQLVQSEEQNRAEIHEVKDVFQDTKKRLWAQRATFGGASSSIERLLKEVEQLFEQFDIETDNGNYLKAREILLMIKEQNDYLNELMDEVPKFLVLLNKELPKQLADLENGMKDMEREGYVLDHFPFKWQIGEMKQRLHALIPLVENLKLNEVEEPIEKIEQEIDEIYKKLEHEVICRQRVEQKLPTIREKVEQLPVKLKQLMEEIEVVKISYRLSEEEDRKQWNLEQKLKELQGEFSVIIAVCEEKKQSFTSLDEKLTEFENNVKSLEKEIESVNERLDLLRKDERKAEETINELREQLLYGQKQLKKSNLPGVPETLLILLDEAEKSLYAAEDKLSEIPLSIDEVVLKVDEAKEHVNKCVERLLKTIENAQLAERVIQYGNRYRREHDDLNIQLLQAEDHFRHYEYDEALELAVTAIERIDSDVLEKVAAVFEEQ